MKQRDEDLAKEVESLKQKLQELEQLAKGKGLAGVFNFKNIQTQTANSTNPAWSHATTAFHYKQSNHGCHIYLLHFMGIDWLRFIR